MDKITDYIYDWDKEVQNEQIFLDTINIISYFSNFSIMDDG